jgi:hypothetical protein
MTRAIVAVADTATTCQAMVSLFDGPARDTVPTPSILRELAIGRPVAQAAVPSELSRKP